MLHAATSLSLMTVAEAGAEARGLRAQRVAEARLALLDGTACRSALGRPSGARVGARLPLTARVARAAARAAGGSGTDDASTRHGLTSGQASGSSSVAASSEPCRATGTLLQRGGTCAFSAAAWASCTCRLSFASRGTGLLPGEPPVARAVGEYLMPPIALPWKTAESSIL